MVQNLLDNKFETEWLRIRGNIRDKWRNLSEEDVNQINGNFELLVSKLQQRYGYTRDQAEEHIQNWISEKTARFAPQDKLSSASSSRESSHDERREGSSLWKWWKNL